MQQRGILFALFVLIEVAILVELGRETSTAFVLSEVLVTALLGYILIKGSSRRTGIEARLALWTMRVPAEHLIKGFMTIIGGILLVLPGIVTDILGLILAFPLTQGLIVGRFKRVSPRIFRQ